MKLRGWFKWSLMIFAAACLTISVGLILKAADRNLRAPASGSNPASDPNAAQTRTSALDLSSAPSKSSASAADPQKSNRVLLDVPHLPQGEQYPSGCESVSAVMALRYLGVQITADEFIDGYLDRGTFTVSNGVTQNALSGAPILRKATAVTRRSSPTRFKSWKDGLGFAQRPSAAGSFPPLPKKTSKTAALF